MKEWKPCSPPILSETPPLNHCCKPLIKSSGLGHIVFESSSPQWPPLPGKAIKLLFPTSPKTLSLRFDLAPVHRETELLVTEGHSGRGKETEGLNLEEGSKAARSGCRGPTERNEEPWPHVLRVVGAGALSAQLPGRWPPSHTHHWMCGLRMPGGRVVG